MKEIKPLYENTLQEYESLYKKKQDRVESLAKFKSVSENGTSLPRSMRTSILNKVVLPLYEDNQEIFKTYTEDMKKLEIDTNKILYDIVVKQKEFEITYLEKSLSGFVETSVDKFKQHITECAAVIHKNTMSVAAMFRATSVVSPGWPVDEIVKLFQHRLLTDLQSLIRKLEGQILSRDAMRKRKAIEDLTMQEQVNEQPAAKTMGKIMQNKTNEAVTPIHSKMQRYEHTQKHLIKQFEMFKNLQEANALMKRHAVKYKPRKPKPSTPKKFKADKTWSSIEAAEKELGMDLQSHLNSSGGDKEKSESKSIFNTNKKYNKHQ